MLTYNYIRCFHSKPQKKTIDKLSGTPAQAESTREDRPRGAAEAPANPADAIFPVSKESINKNQGVALRSASATSTAERSGDMHGRQDELGEGADAKRRDQMEERGLLHFRKWWERIEVDIFTGGKHISGTPIFVEANTLRVVDNDYSYFIPLEKVDFIRTRDGLCSEGGPSVEKPR